MPGNKDQKLKLLYLLDILKTCSDEEHPLNSAEISDELLKNGISSERKSIYNDIDILRQKGYDIIMTKTPKSGYFLAERDFELAEVRLLADAVQSAGFITRKKSLELTNKLKAFVSSHQASELNRHIYIDHRKKTKNEEIYYSIDTIHRAITENKKVDLKYNHSAIEKNELKTVEKSFVLSPYALLWSDDRYYVVANNKKYNDLMHLRVDRIKRVSILDEPSRPFSQVSEYRGFFDVADYANKIFNAFGGELQTVSIRCENKMIDAMLDIFGGEIMIRPGAEESFTFNVKAAVSEGLISSLLQFGNRVEVLSPETLRQEMIKKTEGLKSLYNV